MTGGRGGIPQWKSDALKCTSTGDKGCTMHTLNLSEKDGCKQQFTWLRQNSFKMTAVQA